MDKSDENLKWKIKAVNEIFDEYSKKGYTNAWIFRNHIADTFFVCEWTFNRYINESAEILNT